MGFFFIFVLRTQENYHTFYQKDTINQNDKKEILQEKLRTKIMNVFAHLKMML